MSWTNFKNRLIISMQSNSFGNNIDGFAEEFTSAYDIAIKSGTDTIYRVPVVKGNTELMKSTLSSLLKQTQLSNSATLLDTIGTSVISYWVGVEFSKIPPLIPAIGSIQNIVGVSGIVISTGTWTSLPVLPNNDSNIFLDSFINSAKLHLSTINGIFNVIAQYPPPAPPAPAIINWTGYKVVG